MKSKSVFFCQNCGYESSKWMGQCPGCRSWNSFVEETVSRDRKSTGTSGGRREAGLVRDTAPKSLKEIEMREDDRYDTGIPELNRVLGSGLVRGSLILVGGDPGIGKSTLLLQAAGNLSSEGHAVLYVSGEESLKQIKLRAMRIGDFTEDLKFLCETDLETVEEVIRQNTPEVVIIDSIQTMVNDSVTSAPGSVSQVRETTGVLLRIAKSLGIAIFIVGHVTKEGTVAGPRVLEHMVDTVLYFEGDRHASYRILRAVKNRFGSTNEIGVFEMGEQGLREVTNPSEYMLEGRPVSASGSVVTCSIEGTRPLLIEIQALVTRTNFNFPRRQANGTDYNRVNLLMAVLEKRLGIELSSYDAYVNLTGGLRLIEPALDLAICIALVSSYRNRPVPDDLVAFGEVGLSGEVRSVSLSDNRISEASRLGFKSCIVPKAAASRLSSSFKDMTIHGVSSVREAMEFIS